MNVEPGTDAEAVADGRVWEEFCEQLKKAGQQILRDEAPSDPFNRAEGWRYLTRLTRIALDMFVECSDRDFPSFYMPSHETAKIGADNPDNVYMRAEINGKHDYLITGTRGSVDFLLVSAIAGGYEDSEAKMLPTGSIDSNSGLDAAADGTLEIHVSTTPKPGVWLQITEDTCAILVRQTFLDRNTEEPARLQIARAEAGDARPAPLSAEKLAAGLRGTTAFVENTARLFADWAQGFARVPNTLPPADQAFCQKIGGDAKIFYYHGYYELAEDEVLLVELERLPDCAAWNIQLNNYWMESLDYRYHRIHLNKHSVQVEQDGSVRVAIGALRNNDSGQVPNWLETAGHAQGTMCMRVTEGREQVHPTTHVVKRAELARLAGEKR